MEVVVFDSVVTLFKGHIIYACSEEDTGINEVDGAPGEVEIGYSICREYSGRGYATELLEAMTRFVGQLFGVQTLYGRVMKGNEASVKVLEKCGYSFLREESGAEDDPYGRGMLVYMQEER